MNRDQHEIDTPGGGGAMNNYFKTLLMHSGSDCRADLNRRPEENILVETPMLRRRGCVLSVRILLLFVVIQCGAPALFSQQTINNGSIGGRVTDPTDAVVPGAQVIARQIETNLSAITSTDQDGRFRFPYLRPGSYEVSVSA